MSELAPGSILQKMYLKERISNFRAKSFCEIGSGNGFLSKLLLDKGMTGVGYDLNASACKNNETTNNAYIQAGKYRVLNENFIGSVVKEKYDFIISCMVIEHLDPDTVAAYFNSCKQLLSPGGTIAVFVPANMKFWGIEDEIAGHFKRYTKDDFNKIAANHNFEVVDMAGLNYPISNWLLNLSNHFVKKNEGYKKEMTMQEQTVLSGNRDVKYKTSFPSYFKLFLNDATMYPFHVMQKMNKKNENSMIMYCEWKVKS